MTSLQIKSKYYPSTSYTEIYPNQIKGMVYKNLKHKNLEEDINYY